MSKGEEQVLFAAWHDLVLEVQHSTIVGDDCVFNSLEIVMSSFGPSHNRALTGGRAYRGDLATLCCSPARGFGDGHLVVHVQN